MNNPCGIQQQFSCESCRYNCKTTAHLRSHKRVHMEKTFQCSQCGFKSQRKCSLALHNMIHSGLRPFVCIHSGCTYSSSRARNLVSHQLVHSNLKPFKCNLCGKCFKRSLHLNCHVRSHTGERPYQCLFKDCEYSATSSSDLQRHFRRHTGEKPYRCSYEACEYSFRQASHLKRHMMTHTNGKVYTCSFKNCKYASNHTSDLKGHINRVHLRNKRHACQLCEYRSDTPAELKRHIANNHQKALKTSISRPRLNSFSSSSLIEIESTQTVSNSKLIESLEVDEDPKLSFPTSVLLTRLKPDNYVYNKNNPAISALKFKDSRDPIQKTKLGPTNSASAVDDLKLLIPTVVVLKRLQVNYDSDDDYVGDSPGVQADLTIPTASDCPEMNPDPQTGPMLKEANLYICKICDYETKKFRKYKSHLQSHREQRQFFCPLCDFVGFKKRLLKSHFRTHDNDSSASDSDCYRDTQSHPTRASITDQEVPLPSDNTSVNTNCFASQSSQDKEIEFQQNAMVRIEHSAASIVQLQEIRTKRHQSPLNPNRGSQAKKQTPQSSKKIHVLFSCIFCNKIFKKEMKLLNHLRYHTGEPRP